VTNKSTPSEEPKATIPIDFTDADKYAPRELRFDDAGTVNAIRLVQISNNMPERRALWRSDGISGELDEGNTDHLYRGFPLCGKCFCRHLEGACIYDE
jgi:hypothetical protein